MKFCPKCGSILIMKKTKFGCPRCNYIEKEDITMEVKQVVNERQDVAIVTPKDNVNPITDFDCTKCSNKKSYFWTKQMRSGDESESCFYECTKCGNTVRVDD